MFSISVLPSRESLPEVLPTFSLLSSILELCLIAVDVLCESTMPSNLGSRNRDASNATACLELRELSKIKEFVCTECECEEEQNIRIGEL